MSLGLILLNVRVEDERPIQSWVSIESENSIKIKCGPIVRACLEDDTL